MTDQEVNEAVARKLGYRKLFDGPSTSANATGWGSPDYAAPSAGRWMLDPPDFCHSIAAAWEIVEKFPHAEIKSKSENDCIGDFFLKRLTNEWVAGWEVNSGNEKYRASLQASSDDSAPMAICKAFLQLK